MEDSDSDSDSFTIKIQKLTGVGESSKVGDGSVDSSLKHAWLVENNQENVDYKALFAETAIGIPCHESVTTIEQVTINQAEQAPEEIITDDNIVHTQESVEMDTSAKETQLEGLVSVVEEKDTSVTSESLNEIFFGIVKDNSMPREVENVGHIQELMIDYVRAIESKEDTQLPTVACQDKEGCSKMTNSCSIEDPVVMEVKKVDERRRSERLKETTNIHTMEKVSKMAKKRNLEGNSKNHNAFSLLPIEEIVTISADMGVAINHEDFETFDLLKNLEQARGDLYSKQCQSKLISQPELVENVSNNVNSLELEWLNDENSDIEDFVLVESRKKEEIKERVLRFHQ